MEKWEALDGMKRNQNFHQKLFVLGLQRQSEAIDDAERRQTTFTNNILGLLSLEFIATVRTMQNSSGVSC